MTPPENCGRDYNLGYEHGYSDVKHNRYEQPNSTDDYNRGYREGGEARREFEAAADRPVDRPHTVRIYVQTSVDIDVDAWLDNYGDDLTQNQDDARDYIENVIREQLKSVGVLA